MVNSASERIRDIFHTERVANLSSNDVPRLNIGHLDEDLEKSHSEQKVTDLKQMQNIRTL